MSIELPPEERFASSRLLRRHLFLLRTRTLAPLLRFVIVARVDTAAAEERAQDVHRHREDDGRVLLVADGA